MWNFRVAVLCFLSASSSLAAQGTSADYARAASLNAKYQGLSVDVPERPAWIGKTSRFWYRKSVKGGNEFMVVDVATKEKLPAFDHEKLAAALNAPAGTKYSATTLPFNEISFSDDERSIQFTAAMFNWRCAIVGDHSCERLGPAATRGRGGRGGAGAGPWIDQTSDSTDDLVPFEGPWDIDDGLVAEVLAQREAARPQQQRGAPTADSVSRPSPDGQREGYVRNFNLYVRATGSKTGDALTFDGSEGSAYTIQSILWSPDSKKIALYRVTPGYKRIVRYVQSSPADQLQPKYMERTYAKPGDVLDVREPVLVDVDAKRVMHVDASSFPNAYQMLGLAWRKDSHAFTFEYNQRGHQVYRVIEVDAATGKPRVVISEEPKTFFNYRTANGGLSDSGKRFRFDVADGKEIVWMSERDGWNHLYLYDGITGKVKNQITRGSWVVRSVDKVDEDRRQIWFEAGGMNAGQDPYFTQHYRINFDGTGLAALTDADGTHALTWSADSSYYIDTWSRVDLAPTMAVHLAADRKVMMDVEHPDLSALTAAGWKPPEVFVAKGRDGMTDIWGVIFRPSNFDPAKRYPVIENIYAGPQGSFVPKSFSINSGMRNLAELGFIVVQIDGMGTSNRSKAFQDVAWQNLGDAGFSDRILWHKAVAAKYPSYDITRVGVYGTSAGGQNSLGAMLFHPEFYKAAVSAAGCHDNRMDKMWWNEQWMGWPIGPQYAAASNVDNAAKLQGSLMLIVGELDTNVDPSSTMQVVNALIKANKTFDLLVIPGADHTDGGPYGQLKRDDFFVHYLLGVEPPARNAGQ
ncbi:MAG: DPP IV N-terminal domain-containing protein [Gemmatimonadaceae bacterium]